MSILGDEAASSTHEIVLLEEKPLKFGLDRIVLGQVRRGGQARNTLQQYQRPATSQQQCNHVAVGDMAMLHSMDRVRRRVRILVSVGAAV